MASDVEVHNLGNSCFFLTSSCTSPLPIYFLRREGKSCLLMPGFMLGPTLSSKNYYHFSSAKLSFFLKNVCEISSCFEWGLFGCAVWAMYCERRLEAQIACTDWYGGEDALFSQDCSKNTQLNKASPRGTQGSYEQLKQNPDVLIVMAACLIICILCHVKSSLLDVWEPAVATEVAYWEISKAFVETGWHDLLVRGVLNYTVM